jgi:biotin carboxyl carrier protein
MAELKVASEITGTVWKIEMTAGSRVEEDDVIMILESMKMEIPVLVPEAGVLKEITIKEGANVSEGETLAIIEV